MLKLTPILLAVIYALAMWHFSAWRTRRELDARSSDLVDPAMQGMLDRMARALGVRRVPVKIYEICAASR